MRARQRSSLCTKRAAMVVIAMALGSAFALNVSLNGMRAAPLSVEEVPSSLPSAHRPASSPPLLLRAPVVERTSALSAAPRALDLRASAPRVARAAPSARSSRMEACVTDLTLPAACARARAAAPAAQLKLLQRRRRLGAAAASAVEVQPNEYAGVNALADAPAALYTKCVVDERSTHTVGHLAHSLDELIDSDAPKKTRYSAKSLPTSIVTFCIPDGIVVDNSVAGPTTHRGLAFVGEEPAAAAGGGCATFGCTCQGLSDAYRVSHTRRDFGEAAGLDALVKWWLAHKCATDPSPMTSSVASPFAHHKRAVYMDQGKLWFSRTYAFRDWAAKAPTFVDYKGMGVQLSSWTGWMFNHFAYDGLVRLGIVYERITSNDPLWGSAKIVVALGGTGMDATTSHLSKAVRFIFKRLQLTDRLVANTGWLAKAKRTPRFEYLVFPDIDPLYHCGKGFGDRTKDSVFPRGTFLPVQRALGVLDPSVPRDLIIWAGRTGRRALARSQKNEIFTAINGLLTAKGLSAHLTLRDWQHKGSPSDDFEVFRRAWIVIGPHGGQLWNAAWAKPGTALIEFTTWDDTFVADDCRTCGFGLANAAGQEYHIVETPNWNGYSGSQLMPAVEDVKAIVGGFLDRNIDGIRGG